MSSSPGAAAADRGPTRVLRPGLTGPTDGQMCQPWPVSANLELVRSIYAATERGDYTWAAWAHPEIEFVIPDGPDPGNWTGLAEMADAHRNFMSAWESLRTEADEVREIDSDRVLVLAHNIGRGKIG